MLKSVDQLRDLLSGPLVERLGSEVKLITAEVHGNEFRGLALCPGRVVKYVVKAKTRRLKTFDILKIATYSHSRKKVI